MVHFEKLTPQAFSLDRNTYTYWVIGKPTNPALLILYGYTGLALDFEEMCQLLKEDYFVIIPEFPGWEHSPRLEAGLTIHNYAKYFKQLIDYLGFRKIELFGHCLGSVVAIEFAYLYPQKVRTLLLASVPYIDGLLAKKGFLALAALTVHSPRLTRPIFFFWRSRLFTTPLNFFIMKPKTFRKKMQMMKNHIMKQSDESEDAVEEEWMSYIRYDFNKVKKIQIPAYIIHGTDDYLVRFRQGEKLSNLFHSATFDLIPHAGHILPVESPQELVTYMRKYLPK